MAEKILSKASGVEARAGDYVEAEVDAALMPDLTALLAFKAMMEMGYDKVWNPDRVVVVLDRRVLSRNYGRHFLRSLPTTYRTCRTPRHLADMVRAFLASRLKRQPAREHRHR